MKLLRSLILIAFITGMALLYVHQQVELVKLSYAIECKEKRLKDVLDHNDSLGYNISNLEAPSRLEGVLLAQKIDITFPKRNHVVKATKFASNFRRRDEAKSLGLERKVDILGILDFFGSAREAQAKEK